MPRTAETPIVRRAQRLAPEPYEIIVDTREQEPYEFKIVQPIMPFTVIRATLETGDYSAAGFETELCVERKSKSDAFKSFGDDRGRFEREIVRMSQFRYAAVVIEAEWLEIMLSPPPHSQRMRPKTIVASVVAWSQRYGVHFFAVPGREFAEKLTHRIIERWIRDRKGSSQ